MICQHCQKRPATTYLSETVNGHKQELYLCSACAQKHQSAFFDVGDFMQGFLGQSAAKHSAVRCEGCGMTEAAFLKTGKFGCGACARTFEGRTREVLKRVHGRSDHQGKIPSNGEAKLHQKRELERLQKQLQDAILGEQYEEAARLRDQIRALKGGDGACGTTK